MSDRTNQVKTREQAAYDLSWSVAESHNAQGVDAIECVARMISKAVSAKPVYRVPATMIRL
ncbi:hypothetical protein SAMN06265368_4832 [Cohaesibacter gelatinilyticus]|uniref:Uncharacterized protein n=1 Tax=Cohaesibacter gelatinilyticus TaxID=372072 RepID=A0A285PKB8_9HYPH|nr:hypothetical protein SAMN06265368_4832 [Cohaesibacter gelatinilyticus]